MGQFDYTNTDTLNLLQLGKYIIEQAPLAVIQLISDVVTNHEVARIKTRLIEWRNVRNLGCIFSDLRKVAVNALFPSVQGCFRYIDILGEYE